MTQSSGPGRFDLRDQRMTELDPIPPLDIVAMLRVVWHGKWLVLLTLLTVVGLAGFYAFRIASPQFAATATLHLDRAGISTTEAQQPGKDDATLNTTIAQAVSDPVLANVISELGLLADPEFNRYLLPSRPFAIRTLRTQIRNFLSGTVEQAPDQAAIHEKTVQNLRRTLAVARQSDTYILHITAHSGDPVKAALVANATAQQFLNHNRTRQQQAQSEAELWLQDRIDDLRAQIENQEMQAAALIATAQIQGGNGLDTLSTQVLLADQDLIAAQRALRALQDTPNPGSARNAAEMTQLRNEINEIAARKERISTQLTAQSAGLARLHQIQLQMDATRQIYQTFLRQLHDNRLQQQLRKPNAQQITPAAHTVYVGPRKLLILTVAAVLGSSLGIMIVAIRHLTRNGAIDAQVLRRATGLPVLAQIPNRAIRQLQRGRRALPIKQGSELLSAAQGLQTTLSIVTRGKSAQIILSTSSIAGEGKTALAIALTQALATSGKRVMFVGTDDSGRWLRACLGTDVCDRAQKAWRDGAGDAYAQALGADTMILPANGAPGGLLLHDNLTARLQELRRTYDCIIVDGPPVLEAPEALLMASQSDAIIYSVRWAKTPLHVVRRGLDALSAFDCPATGVVLSKVNMRKMRKLSNDPCIATAQQAQLI